MISNHSIISSSDLLGSHSEEIRPINPIKASNIDKLIAEIIKENASIRPGSYSEHLSIHKITQPSEIITEVDKAAIAVITPSCISEITTTDLFTSPSAVDPTLSTISSELPTESPEITFIGPLILEETIKSSYRKENNFRHIDPSEALTNHDSIMTVIRGERPLRSFSCDPTKKYNDYSEKYFSIAQEISGIKIYPNIRDQQHLIFREGFEEAALKTKKLIVEINEKADMDGRSPILALERTLSYCRQFGELFHYNPKEVESFYNKMSLKHKELSTS